MALNKSHARPFLFPRTLRFLLLLHSGPRQANPKSVTIKHKLDSAFADLRINKLARAPTTVNGGRRPRTYHKDQFDYTDFTPAEVEEVQARPARDRYKAWRNVS